MPELAIFGALVCLIFVVMAWVFYDSERRWRLKMKERWAARDRAREESMAWFHARLAQEQAREQAPAPPVAQISIELHNPARRRFLPLNEPRT